MNDLTPLDIIKHTTKSPKALIKQFAKLTSPLTGPKVEVSFRPRLIINKKHKFRRKFKPRNRRKYLRNKWKVRRYKRRPRKYRRRFRRRY